MSRALIALACCCVSIGAQAVTLSPGDVLGLQSGGIVRIDPATGAQTQVAAGSFQDFAIGADGRLYATQADSVLRIDPADGTASVLSSGVNLLAARSIAVAGDGRVFVSTTTAAGGADIVGVDPTTGAQQVVASAASIYGLQDLGVASGNRLALLKSGQSPFDELGVLAFADIDTGVITFTPSGSDRQRTGLAVSVSGEIFSSDNGAQCGCTYRWDALASLWRILAGPPYPPGSEGSDGIFDIAVEASGDLLLAENGVDAQVYRFDPLSDGFDPASYTALTSGSFSELEVVPVPEPATALSFAAGLVILASLRLRRR